MHGVVLLWGRANSNCKAKANIESLIAGSKPWAALPASRPSINAVLTLSVKLVTNAEKSDSPIPLGFRISVRKQSENLTFLPLFKRQSPFARCQ